MTQTKTQKVFAGIALAALSVMNFSPVYGAIQIGTGSVTGTNTFDAAINWDETFTTGSAVGSVSNIKIKARVNPSLNMEISAEEIDLEVLSPGIQSEKSLFIEVGTNAKSGISITARSQNGGLENTTSPNDVINNADNDGESYTYRSTPNTNADSSSSAFTATGLASATQVNNNTTEHTVYTTNKSESANAVDDVQFFVAATATAETPAGDYEDFITFTVTGNF